MKLNEIQTKGIHEEGRWMTVTNPTTGEVTDFKIKFVGSDSSAYRRSVRALANRIAMGEDLDQDNEQSIIIAGLILDWSGLYDDDGSSLPFDRKVAESLMKNSPWLCDQSEMFVTKRSNFTNG